MKKTYKKMLNIIRRVAYHVIIVIGIYGIVIAPSTDKSSTTMLQEELKSNEKYLKKQYDEENEMLNQEIIDKNYDKDELGRDKEAENKKSAQKITVIGDSVTLGAARGLIQVIPNCNVEAKDSRQVRNVMEIIKNLEVEDKLGDTVVIALGTNGYFNISTGQEIIDYLGIDRNIYWVNVYGKSLQSQYATNDVIADLVNQNENLKLIDWHEEGAVHPDWFISDGIHLTKEGAKGYAQFINSELQLDK